jgi:hypothetical protein
MFAGIVCVSGAVGEDDQPFQFREPERFWMHQVVFQKRGIVIEDDDFIVRDRYWILDKSVIGQVVKVDSLARGVNLTVRFDEMGAGWQAKGINVRDRTLTTTQRSVTVRPERYGDGATVETDEVTFSCRIEGDRVDPDRCGLIVRREGNVIFVRFPSSLISLISPSVGDRVIRSFDWHDGLADGGSRPSGVDLEGSTDCFGIVERERDDKGFIDVRWERTGRRKRHRFDNVGYYDVQLVSDAGDP